MDLKSLDVYVGKRCWFEIKVEKCRIRQVVSTNKIENNHAKSQKFDCQMPSCSNLANFDTWFKNLVTSKLFHFKSKTRHAKTSILRDSLVNNVIDFGIDVVYRKLRLKRPFRNQYLSSNFCVRHKMPETHSEVKFPISINPFIGATIYTPRVSEISKRVRTQFLPRNSNRLTAEYRTFKTFTDAPHTCRANSLTRCGVLTLSRAAQNLCH